MGTAIAVAGNASGRVDRHGSAVADPVLVLSQFVEKRYATELLSGETSGVGYVLEQRVADVRHFLDALKRVANGGTALDPEVVAQLLARASRYAYDELTPRESESSRLWPKDFRTPGSRSG